MHSPRESPAPVAAPGPTQSRQKTSQFKKTQMMETIKIIIITSEAFWQGPWLSNRAIKK